MRAYEPVPVRRILLAADDRRFRALAATLLSRRGFTVSVCPRDADVSALARRERAVVVVLDASASLTTAARDAARLAALEPPVGIVAVSGEDHCGLTALPVVAKWGPFDALFAAIERARTSLPRHAEVTSVAS